ncbi:MAG: hypothetical protein ACI9MR_000951 [Myxococcota bacterium]|jgi:hypothetical protein
MLATTASYSGCTHWDAERTVGTSIETAQRFIGTPQTRDGRWVQYTEISFAEPYEVTYAPAGRTGDLIGGISLAAIGVVMLASQPVDDGFGSSNELSREKTARLVGGGLMLASGLAWVGSSYSGAHHS